MIALCKKNTLNPLQWASATGSLNQWVSEQIIQTSFAKQINQFIQDSKEQLIHEMGIGNDW